MRHYLLAAACLALASCAAQKALPHYTPEQQAAQRESIGFWQPDSLKAIPKLSPAAQRKLEARRRRGQAPAPVLADGGQRPLDSTVAVPYAHPQPGRSTAFWQKVNPFRVKQPRSEAIAQADKHVGQLPRKCKGCTFNVVAGNQTVAGKKAQLAAGDGAAVVVADKKAGPVVLADSGAEVKLATVNKGQAAAGEGISQEHEEVKPGPWPAIIGGVGLLGGVGLVYWLVAGGGALWVASLFRRRKPETQA